MSDVELSANIAAPRPGRWKRRLIRAGIVLCVLALGVAYLLKDYIRTLESLRRVPGTKAYVMDYYANYNMAEVRAHGIDVQHVDDSFLRVLFPRWFAPIAVHFKSAYLDEPITTIPTGDHCSTVVYHSADGHVYFGRNFDYFHDGCLILKIHSGGAVQSVAVLDLHYLNLDRDDLDQTSLLGRVPLLLSPYYLEDGMNRYGVAVSDMAVDGVHSPNDPSHPDIIHSAAMRLILDYAKNTDEAVELLKEFNIHFVAETCHLMIADASGKSVAIEFIDGQLKPTTTKELWQICTNHQLCGKNEAENCEACNRYKLAAGELKELAGNGKATDVMKVMQSVSQGDFTMWSSVYDLSKGDFEVAYHGQYDKPFSDRINIAP